MKPAESNSAPVREPQELESLLRSAVQRVVLVAALVVVAALLMTAHLQDLYTATRSPQPWLEVFGHQLLMWSLWGLFGFLLVRFAAWLRSRWSSWLLFAAIQVPLSYVVAAGFAEAYDRSAQWIYTQPPIRPALRGPRPDGDPLRPRFDEDPLSPRPRPDPNGFGPAGPPGAPPPGQLPGGTPVPTIAGSPFGDPERGFPVRLRFNLAVYWLVLGLGAGIDAFLRANERERLAVRLRVEGSKLESELARAQLSALRDQIHPHFFFNSLHTVAGLIREKREAEALRVIVALGDLLRTTLDGRAEQEVTLREDLRIAERYLEIERIRYGSRLDARFEVDPDATEARVPALLLQPLVENAVRHGVEPRLEGGKIRVLARRDGGDLLLEVRDDGPGFPAEVLAGATRVPPTGSRRSIGLANDRERLRLLYRERQSLVLENDPAGGAVVRIRIPFTTGAREDASHA